MRAIVAVDRNWGIGREGQLLARLPADLKRFREMTLGGTVITGRKTVETFPGGRPLAGRRNLILSRSGAYTAEGGEVFGSIPALLSVCPGDAFVIGGEQVYRALLAHCDTVFVTQIDAVFPADAWFPNLDADPAWMVAERGAPMRHEGLTYSYVTYARAK